jgi:hypothetical protein
MIVNPQAMAGKNSKNQAVFRCKVYSIRKSSRSSHYTTSMTGGIVSYILNRNGGNNLQDDIYKKTRSLKDHSYWIC